MSEPLILHEYAASGNCYKVRLAAALTGRQIERREYDILKGETRTPEFLANVNGNGRIPVLQVGDRFIPESNASAFYVASGSALIPAESLDQADMLRWMFWEQYNHEPNIATLRFWMGWVGNDKLTDLQRAQMPGKREAGEAALALMDEHLSSREWFVAGKPTLSDICLYAYTHVAGDADFDLSHYPAVERWLRRFEGQPGYIPMSA